MIKLTPRVRWIAIIAGVLSPTILIGLWQFCGRISVRLDLAMIPGLSIAIVGTLGLVLSAPVETRLKLLLLFVSVWAMIAQVILFWVRWDPLPVIAI